MSHFIVEYRDDGKYVMDTVHGVEDIDVTQYKNILGIWVCDTKTECDIMQKELKEMRHARSS